MSDQTTKPVYTREKKYDMVNQTENLKQLADVIRSFADYNGMILGRTRSFNAENMARACEGFRDTYPPNFLTREFGIRQQAFMLHYYGDLS